PESLDLQRYLREMVDVGVEYALLEVSSHSLILKRTIDCDFNCGIFTNLTQDHLDFHGTIDGYLEAKKQLFIQLNSSKKRGKVAVINEDDPASLVLKSAILTEILTFGLKPSADIRAEDIKIRSDGLSFKIMTPWGKLQVLSPLIGRYNVYNILAAVACTLVEGVSKDDIVEGIANLKRVSGRFESIKCGQPFSVVVDYAHTDDALKNVLQAARELTKKRVITVFGCGGDRDKGKRPLMGEVAGEYSDYVIITSDNPRSEDPLMIIDEIEKGVLKSRGSKGYIIIPDRYEAIKYALDMVHEGDMLLIAGKGHETGQLIRNNILPFDDREVAREILNVKSNNR
ncbi:MAG: UDP-N-acetylmuramoyl-L-alanyl-D-glutamate--2,6-diaminopimelate ligase, partial [bacterium]